MPNYQLKMLTAGVSALVVVLGVAAPAWSQEKTPNPLEITTPDLLLPESSVERPLSPLELLRFKEELDQLNAQATAQYQAGNAAQAFDIWNRELRLRRTLGTLEEVRALGRVGEVAWEGNQKTQVQVITKRLEAIQQELEKPSSSSSRRPQTSQLITKDSALSTNKEELREALGKAYEQVRSPQQALTIYEQILAQARQSNDVAAKESTLKTMGQLQMAYFDYPKAAATYEELLKISQDQSDVVDQVEYLKQLSYIYDKAKEPENALKVKLRLVESYQAVPNNPQFPALLIAIASDYHALNQPEQASQNYQQAYTLAVANQQFGDATEALQKLGALYQQYEQPEFALQIYEVLLQIEQRSYDYYGLMNTYDKMGQIHLQQQNYPQALTAFQEGLELARSLQYEESHFTKQIEQINQQP
ncbi:MAG: tetratricopeptide repeat protein [Kastovskya adunca ATA6-11-RM4]|jgi:tetratricopeptide (TPR) repeat protein|nr:tetratricopeptide repeat protein [Kastovskya adunca ATA6-11-RM4]